ncbi:pyridoxal phosphate-dependent aminotransferase [Streptomyces sp. NPDC058989]|uniref:pyridoxal phosphate-dependent aminotransferase n=1 Tax=Streptomyces sp. NPDC058989 TaxID=3346686 RepID=UPI00368FD6D6
MSLPAPVLNLAVAENVLLYDSLKEDVFKNPEIGPEDIRYKRSYGTDELRQHIARLLKQTMSPIVEADDIYATAGVSGALECLAFALEQGEVLEPGDQVLLPAPSWQGFKWCFEQRPGLRCVFAPLPVTGAHAFQLTLKALQDAYDHADPRPKLLVLTNPNNPLGANYSKELLESIYTWALTKTDMHIISDEMYAHSQVAEAKPGFHSAFSLGLYPQHQDRVHVVWGLAKDFGLSGFRAGFVLSRSAYVRKAMRGGKGLKEMSWFSPLDSLKNVVVGKLFRRGADKGPWYPEQLMRTVYPERLTASYEAVKKALSKAGVPFLSNNTDNAAQFFFLDLRKYLGKVPAVADGDVWLPVFPEIDDREEKLRAYLEKEAQVQLLPGQTLFCPSPGYFRLCFTAYGQDKVVQAVDRIGAALKKLG